MKDFSIININEAQTGKKLSKDFALKGDDWRTAVARHYLKALDARVEELGLNYEQCREAARLFKKGEFEKSLKKIWGSKVKVDERNENNGYTHIITYTISNYAMFTEIIDYTGLQYYRHEISAEYINIENPSYVLKKPLCIYIKKQQGDFAAQINAANKEGFASVPCAWIYDFLFVCFDGRDLSSSLSKYHLRLENKLGQS